MNETFLVGSGEEQLAGTVRQAERFDTLHGVTGTIPADGVFIAVVFTVENRADEPISMGHGEVQLVDEQGRTFSTDGDAFGVPNNDPRIPADQMLYEDLQPGLSVTRAVVFDVPPEGSYAFQLVPREIPTGDNPPAVPLDN